ncbi:MAG: hypothetical protein HKP58_00065, partial [Desulfatitalea sp.]|nr:hypothetical protein [Desulfatitalea sp.]NNJ98783.1 hypothetical protein [Desulfatitalea sp.]
MQADTDHNGFAQWVRQIFEHGFSLDGDTRAYMAQTFGSTDLSVVLEKGDESETAALLELIFSPDTVMRLTFEAQWGLVRFRPEQVAALFTALTVQPLKTHIFSDTNHSGMALLVPAFGVSAFIRRLNLTWQPPEALDVFLKAGPAHTNPIAIRDRFRHARVRWAAHRVELVTAYLKQVTHKAADINDGLVFLLSILDEFE